jgi:hypothetical protein
MDTPSKLVYGNTDGDGATPSGGLVIDGSGKSVRCHRIRRNGELRAAGDTGGVWHGVRFSPPK